MAPGSIGGAEGMQKHVDRGGAHFASFGFGYLAGSPRTAGFHGVDEQRGELLDRSCRINGLEVTGQSQTGDAVVECVVDVDGHPLTRVAHEGGESVHANPVRVAQGRHKVRSGPSTQRRYTM